ncbi:MAG TPA: bi-domain-containing oxidoreductase [Gemmatimonadales bacterium]|jgi:predicted dehydrogenase/threonine dehydrogenase-like Zn-dependent dehydrogenase
MKQILQSLKTGVTEVADVPSPGPSRGALLIHSRRTLISAGTERMLVEFGRAGLIDKARQQPDKVKMVLDKVRTDGLLPTLASVQNKLDQPLALGYCNVGVIAGIGSGVAGLAIGERVASAGKHAEVVSVPVNLCARVPDAVSDDQAAFTVLGAIALQGIRLAQPSLGEAVAVTGLGLVGLLAVQLLRAHGCRVLGIDLDPARLAMARRFGAETVDLSSGADPVQQAMEFSRGRGMDAVIITASTTSNEPVHQAALMSRQRGRIVLVGVTGLELSRDDFYKKELTFQVSSSYGPGRYDPDYEEKGQDYPVGFVRWTEQRNFEAVLDMMADGRLDVGPLISHRFKVVDAEAAYALVASDAPSLGILLEYPDPGPDTARRTVATEPAAGARPAVTGQVSVSFVGAGNYATAVLIPAFKEAGARLRIVASGTGVSGTHAARKFGFEATTTDTASVFSDASVNAVVIATRHDSHASLVRDALAAGKHVFVEKPLALTAAELDGIESAAAARPGQIVMVGFNRRFAPHVVRMRTLLAGIRGPRALVMTVNAGSLPSSHWTQDPGVGGGRIIGEGCHFIDLLRGLAGSPIVGVEAAAMAEPSRPRGATDTASILLHFEDGSLGTILYIANGHNSFPKERLEVFAGGRILQLDNFRVLKGYGWSGFRTMSLWRQDKGQAACAAAFLESVRTGGPPPIPFAELMEVSRRTVEVAEVLR